METIRLSLTGNLSGLEKGIEILAGEKSFSSRPGGLPVSVEREEGAGIRVRRNGAGASIRYDKPIHFFRGLGLLLENMAHRKEFEVSEEPQFTMNGAMIDMSQGNAVLRVEAVEGLLVKMSLMGLNMLMLYAEDSYEVAKEPWFGYMRGRITQAEMRRLDGFASALGIELIPCIQTLAHLIDVLKWSRFHLLRDDEDTLLVGCEEAYEFIGAMIDAAAAPCSTRRIHIGMDEAWKLGLGRYLELNGFTRKFDIMNAHLARVADMAEKRGLSPMIWSDMYFRAASKTGAYYDREAVIPEEVLRAVPRGVQLVYWDYYHTDRAFYEDFIARHRRFGSDPIFAGGIWNWYSFGVNYGTTFDSTDAALEACKKLGLREVFATVWGDDANESMLDSVLLGLQLYAEHGYARTLDREKLARRFAFCTGGRFEDFRLLSAIDEVPGVPKGNPGMANPSRWLLWQDPLLGLYDENVRGFGLPAHYGDLSRRMAESAGRNGGAGPIFDVLGCLCAALELKAELGIRMSDAYGNGDRQTLRTIADRDIPELERRIRILQGAHRKAWMAVYKPLGWEILDIRYGGAMQRLRTASERLLQYLAGEIPAIEELEEPRMPFDGKKGPIRPPSYARMASASRLSFTF
jgi:hexosaminidase